jgi:hypothetical protein
MVILNKYVNHKELAYFTVKQELLLGHDDNSLIVTTSKKKTRTLYVCSVFLYTHRSLKIHEKGIKQGIESCNYYLYESRLVWFFVDNFYVNDRSFRRG